MEKHAIQNEKEKQRERERETGSEKDPSEATRRSVPLTQRKNGRRWGHIWVELKVTEQRERGDK